MDVSGEEAKKRGGYGEERYEREDFQVRGSLTIMAILRIAHIYKSYIGNLPVFVLIKIRILLSFQISVRKNYDKLFDDKYWKIINTDGKTQEQVFGEVEKLAQEVIAQPKLNEPERL